jgi:hypothetical protein
MSPATSPAIPAIPAPIFLTAAPPVNKALWEGVDAATLIGVVGVVVAAGAGVGEGELEGA